MGYLSIFDFTNFVPMRRLFLLSIAIFFSTSFLGQISSFKSKKVEVKRLRTVNPKNVSADYNVHLISHEAPMPDENSVQSHILQQKIKSRALFPIKEEIKDKKTSTTPSPVFGESFGMVRYLPNGTEIPLNAGIPNDNTLAISRDGIVLMGVNSFIYAHNLDTDSAIFPAQSMSLLAVAGLGGQYYDPK